MTQFDENKIKFPELIKLHFPEAEMKDIEHILWALTPYPCVKYSRLVDAINATITEIKETMNSWECSFKRALSILTDKHWDMVFYHEGLHGDGI